MRPAASRAALVALFLGATALPAQTTERYVAFGDSITRGLGDTAGKGGYPGRLAVLLTTAEKTVTVENEGVDGETTAEGLSRVKTLSGSAEDTFLLMEGTNDIFKDVSAETIATNLATIIQRARSRGFGHAALATIIPIGRTTSGTATLAANAATDEMRQTAYEMKLIAPDPNRAFRDVKDVFSHLYSSDNIHPNSDGYDVMAQHYADVLLGVDNLAPAQSFVSPPHTSVNVAPDAVLSVTVFDPIAGVDAETATLTLDEVAIPTNVSGDLWRTVLQAKPGNLTGKRILGIDVRDRAIPANQRIADVSEFTIRGTTFLTGDIDESGRVDGADLVLLGVAFGANSKSGRYDPGADLDQSGLIDGSDLALLSANFGKSSF